MIPGARCNCPNGCNSQGVLSQEAENHDIGCRFRIKFKKMKFEYIPIVCSNNSGSSSFNNPTSARREL